ncbi:MAG: hypothetical protein ACR2M0_08695 [Chloroflexia bacterium]
MAEVIAIVLCLYGLALALALAPLHGLWRTRRMGQNPVRVLSTIAIAVLGVLLLVVVRQVYLPVSQDYNMSNMGNEVCLMTDPAANPGKRMASGLEGTMKDWATRETLERNREVLHLYTRRSKGSSNGSASAFIRSNCTEIWEASASRLVSRATR